MGSERDFGFWKRDDATAGLMLIDDGSQGEEAFFFFFFPPFGLLHDEGETQEQIYISFFSL